MRLARSLPRFTHPRNLALSHTDTPGLATLLRVAAVHAMIRTLPLPFNATHDQARVLRRLASRDAAQAANACLLHVCLRCPARVPDKTIRAGATGIICGHCLTDDYMLVVNVFGRIIDVCGRKFYLCSSCVQVHAWTGSGHELHHCPNEPPCPPRPRGCAICTNTSSINRVHVLDSRLGVIQHFVMCNRHMPYEHHMRYVHDIDSFIAASQRKYRK
jgi:hypothetical protein